MIFFFFFKFSQKKKEKTMEGFFSDTIINLNYQHKVINLSNDNSTHCES
jgi:hypothetical protein